jgi:hypothetical protein
MSLLSLHFEIILNAPRENSLKKITFQRRDREIMRRVAPAPHPKQQALAQAKKQQLEDFLWKKTYTPLDVASVQRICLHENAYLEADFPGFHLWAEAFFRASMMDLYPHASFKAGLGPEGPASGRECLHILFFHPRMPQIQVPEIYLLVNVLDVTQPWIHQYNIYLFTKAYRILDAKYANLRGYTTHPRIASQVHYLPLITPSLAISPETLPPSSKRKIYMAPPTTDRQRLYLTLLSAVPDFEITHRLGSEGVDTMLCILSDEANSLHPSWQMEYAIQSRWNCICEKSAMDIYHENYYFDKVVFVDRLHPTNLPILIQRISALPRALLPPLDRTKDLARNGLQWRKVMAMV